MSSAPLDEVLLSKKYPSDMPELPYPLYPLEKYLFHTLDKSRGSTTSAGRKNCCRFDLPALENLHRPGVGILARANWTHRVRGNPSRRPDRRHHLVPSWPAIRVLNPVVENKSLVGWQYLLNRRASGVRHEHRCRLVGVDEAWPRNWVTGLPRFATRSRPGRRPGRASRGSSPSILTSVEQRCPIAARVNSQQPQHNRSHRKGQSNCECTPSYSVHPADALADPRNSCAPIPSFINRPLLS